MNVLGIDVGSKKCGFALLETKSEIISPLPTVSIDDKFWTTVVNLITSYHIEHIVLGLPSYEHMQKRVMRFSAELSTKTKVPISLVSEDYSSIIHKSEILSKKAKENLDSLSATDILTQWASQNMISF